MAELLGRIASAFTKVKTGFGDPEGNKSLQDFLNKISDYGTIVNCRFEVSFSGLEDITFFVQAIDVPSIRQNFTNLSYEGQIVEVPINFEFDHDFTMTVINDGKGYIYSTIVNWLMTVGGESILNSGYTMTLRCFGDGINTDGLTITFNGVRFKSVSGLAFNSSNSDISTFTIACSAVNFTATAGKLQKAAGVAGAIADVFGIDASSIVQSIGN